MYVDMKQNAKNNCFMVLLTSAKMTLVSSFLPSTGNNTVHFCLQTDNFSCTLSSLGYHMG